MLPAPSRLRILGEGREQHKDGDHLEGRIPVTLASATRYILAEAAPVAKASSAAFANANPLTKTTIELPIDNNANQALAADCYVVDADGNRSFQHLAQVREIWQFGGAGQTTSFQGSMVLPIEGTLAIGSDQSPQINLLEDANARAVQVKVKQAPTGAGITVALYLGVTLWMTLTIPAGQVFVKADDSQIAGAATITGGTNMRQDLTAVGTTFPGADLSTQIFY